MNDFDLIIIGTGSGNSILTPDFDDANVAIVEKGVFGGTCLNVGCIPSKMFVYTADLALQASDSSKYGISTSYEGVDWPALRDRVFGRIDPIAAGGEKYRSEEQANVTVFKGEGSFAGPNEILVTADDGSETRISSSKIVIAAGARVSTPPIPGLDEVGYYTSDTVMRLDELPDRMVVIGAGYIASELGHVFSSLGVDVTFLNRSAKMLRNEDDDISDRFTEVYSRRNNVLSLVADVGVSRTDTGSINVDMTVDGTATKLETDAILVATGRTPNGDRLNLEAAGVASDDAGYIVTDDHGRTNVDGVWALGDVTTALQLKHSANHEARVVAHNLAHPDDLISRDLSLVPHAVFGNPQVAAVGLTEREVLAQGTPYVVKIQNYGDTAYGWAMEDSDSFVKLIAHAETRLLLGAHIIGPQASTLIQQLIQGMRFGQTVDEMANDQMYIHPALSEVIENALLGL